MQRVIQNMDKIQDGGKILYINAVPYFYWLFLECFFLYTHHHNQDVSLNIMKIMMKRCAAVYLCENVMQR